MKLNLNSTAGDFMKSIVPLAAVCLACCMGVMSASAKTVDARLTAMDKELNCVSNHVKSGVDWNDVCYTSSGTDKDRLVTKSIDQMIDENNAAAEELSKGRTVDTISKEHGAYADSVKSVDDTIREQGVLDNSADTTTNTQQNLDSSRANEPQYVQYAQNTTTTRDTIDYSPEGSLSTPPQSINDRAENQNKFELDFELDHQRYVEPIFDLEDTGFLYGIYGSYTVRPSKSENMFEDIIDMYKVDLRYDIGKIDYKTSTSAIDNITDWTFEVRGLLGKDFPVLQDARLTPYAGFGFRYYNDDFVYERESRYFYIPVGLEFTTHLTEGWLVSPTVEYDIFLSGTQESHLSQSPPAGQPDLKNDQNTGFGMRGSVKFIKENKLVNFVIEPYIRFWHIDDSETVTAVGPVFIATGTEPENKTTEYGVRLGAQF
jgi:hypothetical protein